MCICTIHTIDIMKNITKQNYFFCLLCFCSISFRDPLTDFQVGNLKSSNTDTHTRAHNENSNTKIMNTKLYFAKNRSNSMYRFYLFFYYRKDFSRRVQGNKVAKLELWPSANIQSMLCWLIKCHDDYLNKSLNTCKFKPKT